MNIHRSIAFCLLLAPLAACYDVDPQILDPVEDTSDTPDPRDPTHLPDDRTDDPPGGDDRTDDPVDTPPILPPSGGGELAFAEVRWASTARPNNANLDLHVVDPQGEHIFYLNTTSSDETGRFADHPECPAFDCDGSENSPSERIYWETDRMHEGAYEVWVSNDSDRAAAFEIEINAPGTHIVESHTVEAGGRSSTWVFVVEPETTEPPVEEPADCLGKLKARGVKFRPISISEGSCQVKDGVMISGAVNGITYRYDPSRSTTRLRTSCEIALKLYDSAALMKEHDIDTVYHKGSYACRNKRRVSGLSQHAFGRAMDYSGFRTKGGTEYSVVRHWQHRTNNPTTTAAKVLREIATGLKSYYPIVLDADHDADHDDHFHAALRGR